MSWQAIGRAARVRLLGDRRWVVLCHGSWCRGMGGGKGRVRLASQLASRRQPRRDVVGVEEEGASRLSPGMPTPRQKSPLGTVHDLSPRPCPRSMPMHISAHAPLRQLVSDLLLPFNCIGMAREWVHEHLDAIAGFVSP